MDDVAALPLIDLCTGGKVSLRGHADQRDLFFWFSLSLRCGRLRTLCAGVLRAGTRSRQWWRSARSRCIAAGVFDFVSYLRVVGLAWASDVGIWFELLALACCCTCGNCSLGGCDGRVREGALTAAARRDQALKWRRWCRGDSGHGNRVTDLTQLALVSLTWARRWPEACGCCARSCRGICGGARETVYPEVAHGKPGRFWGGK